MKGASQSSSKDASGSPWAVNEVEWSRSSKSRQGNGSHNNQCRGWRIKVLSRAQIQRRSRIIGFKSISRVLTAEHQIPRVTTCKHHARGGMLTISSAATNNNKTKSKTMVTPKYVLCTPSLHLTQTIPSVRHSCSHTYIVVNCLIP